MEHRHIPAAKDGSIPDAKTRFRRGQDIFLEDVWYGRDLRRADPPAEAVVLVPERSFSASRCSVFSDPYLAPQPGCQD